MPWSGETRICRMVKERDAFSDAVRSAVSSNCDLTAVVHPLRSLAKYRRLANSTFTVCQRAAAEMSGQALGNSHRQESEIRFSEFQRFGSRTECRLDLQQRFARFGFAEDDNQFLFEQ